jgi:hypothetical protein
MPVIREKRQYESVGPVGVVRMNTGEVEMYQRIANANQQLTEFAIKTTAAASKRVGAERAEQVDATKINSINPKTGKPEALDGISVLLGMGNAEAQAYERVVNERFQQSIENEIKQKAGEIALKFENDPYSPEKYEEQMTSYLDSMIEGSKSNGKDTAYTNFIMNTGTQYITATKLNMMQERIRLDRAKTAQSVLSNIDDRQDLIRQMAMNISKMPEGANRTQAEANLSALIEATVESAKDAESSRLLKNGAADATQQVSSTVYGEAYITGAMEGLDPTSAANLALAFADGDPSDLPDDLREIYDSATKYMYRTVKGADGKDIKVLNYEALDGVARAAKAKVQELTNDFQVNLPVEQLVTDAFVNESIGLAGNLGSAVFGSDMPVSQMADLIDEKLNSAFGILDSKYLDPASGLTKAQLDSAKQDIRGALAQDLLVVAYDNHRGSPETARMEISDAYNRKDTSKLKGKTKAAVDTLIRTAVPVEDDARIEEFILDLQSNDVRNTAKFGEQQKAAAYSELSNLKNDVSTGNEEAYRKSLSLASSEYFSGTQQAAETAKVNAAYASSFVGNVMRGYVVGQDGKNRKVTSSDLALAAAYALNGDDRGVPSELKDAVDSALGYSDRETVAASINRREVSLSKVEADLKAGSDKKALIKNISSNQIINNPTATDSDTVEDYLLQISGMDNFFESSEMFNPANPAAQFLFKSTMSGVLPATLKTSLEDLAGGSFQGSAEAAKNVLTFYSQMANQPRGNAIVNAFKGLPDDTISKLEAIAQIHYSTGDEIGAVAAQMADNERDDGFAVTRRRAFAKAVKSKNPNGIDTTEFVMAAVEDAAQNAEAINTLVPLADYLFSSLDAETIKTKLNNFYDRSFVKTQGYVLDRGSRTGDRSRYALNAVFNDEEVQDFFIRKVNNELGGPRISMKPLDDQIEDRAFLMPMGVYNGGVTYLAVKRQGGLLVPIPNPKMNNMPFAFSTSEADVAAFAEGKGISVSLDNLTMEDIIEMRGSADQSVISKDTPRSFFSGGGFMSGGFR